jgi:hypothetical protein
MTQSGFIPFDERIADTMIGLACAAKSDRIILAGPNSFEMFLELHRRGYPRVTTTRIISRAPCGQHDTAFIAWRAPSVRALEAMLEGLVHFLSAAGILVVWIGPHQTSVRWLSLALEKLGFRIESGTCCENGVILSARRLEPAREGGVRQ